MIFLDNASTTQIGKESLRVFNEVNENNFYNASALYRKGVESKNKLENARKEILNHLGANSEDNLIFTSGATESNNMIIRSIARNKNSRLIFSVGEHPSVYNVAMDLLSQGYMVEFAPLGKDGRVDIKEFEKLVDEKTAFVSIMHVSNETGAINNIKEMVDIVKKRAKRAIFHVDGVQAFGKIPFSVSDLGVDAYTISAHKLHGPKGVGALYLRKGINVKPFMLGGGQENNLRSGTENLAGILAFSKASEEAQKNMKLNFEKVSKLNKILREELIGCGIEYQLNSYESNSPYIVSISIPKVRAESILYMLEDEGFLIGNGSACSSKKKDNRVLSAMGVPDHLVEGSIRVSFANQTTENDVMEFVKKLKLVVLNYLDKTNRR